MFWMLKIIQKIPKYLFLKIKIIIFVLKSKIYTQIEFSEKDNTVLVV